MSTTSLSKLISTRKEELAKLWELRGTNFPAVERQKDLRISFIELELADLEKLNKQPQLNDNQQIVLDWLKDYCDNSKWSFPFYVVMHAVHEMPASTFGFYDDFTEEEEFEVLAAFAQWGREQVEE